MLHDSDEVAVVARSQSREPFELDVRRAARAGRAARAPSCSGSAWAAATASSPTCRTSPRRSSRFLATASLGAIWASVSPEFGAAQRDRPLRADRAEGAGGGRRLHAPRQARSTAREEVAAIRAGLPTLEHVDRVGDARRLGALTRAGELGVRARAVRPPALRAVLVAARPGLPKPIVHGHGGILLEHHKNLGLSWDLKPGERLLRPTTTAWMMWNALVSALLLRGSIVMFDGDAAWPDLGELWRLAAETEATHRRRQPGLPDGLPQGRRASSRDGPASESLATAGSPLPAGGLRLRLRAARPRRPADQRQRRHRRLQRDRLRLPDAAGLPRRDRRPLPRRRHGRVRPRRQRGRRRARRARDQAADAVDAGALLERPGRRALPRSYFDMYPGVWRQGDWVRFSEQGTCVITGRSDATLNRGGVRHGDERALRGRRGVRRRSTTASSCTSRTTRAAPGELVLFVVADLDDELRGRIAGALRSRALAAPRAGHDRRRARDPAHADRQEARGAGQADPARRAGGYGRQPRRARGAARDRCFRAVHRGEEERMTVVQPALAPPRIVSEDCPTAAAILRSEMALEPLRGAASASCCGTGPRRRRTASSWPSGPAPDGDWVELTWGEAESQGERRSRRRCSTASSARSGR